MKVYHSLEAYEQGPHPVVTIGTFDGLHIGHKTILKRIREAADNLGGEAVMVTFDPHPRLVLFPEKNSLRLLQTLDEKIAHLEKTGIDKLLVIPFTKDFSRTQPYEFIKKILVETIGMEKIVIGYDHRFGKNRDGGIEKLQEYSENFGYSVEEIPAQAIDDANISSTKIRNALLEGDIATANRYLGYPYPITGKVIHGEKQGRRLGYPTANLKMPQSWKLIPANGVYFVRVNLLNWGGIGTKSYFGMMNIGTKPTMGEFERGLEVFIFDFDGEIYGKTLKIEMLEFLREEKKFDNIEELIQAMDGDKAKAMGMMERF